MSYVNPVLSLPAMPKLRALLPGSVRAEAAVVLRELSKDCDRKGEHAWKTRKFPMAAYWKIYGVYFRHLARALR